MAGKELIYKDDARKAVLKANPVIAYCIDNIKTVDAVEVVRCKNCAVPHNKWIGCPNLNGLIPPPDFYCAYGERMSDNANDHCND